MTPEEREEHYFEEIHPRLEKLTRAICERTANEDSALRQAAYRELVEFYEEQRAAGHWHPWFTESVADFTEEPATALEYYRRALEESRKLREPAQSILIAMGETLFALGQAEQAEAFVRDGRAEAVRNGDEFYIAKADEVLREAGGGGEDER